MDREAKSMEQIREATRHYLLAIKELKIDDFEEIRMMLEQYTGYEYDLIQKGITALEPSTEKKSGPDDARVSDPKHPLPSCVAGLEPGLVTFAWDICKKVLLGLEYDYEGEYCMTDCVCFCLHPYWYRKLNYLYEHASGIVSSIAGNLYAQLYKDEGKNALHRFYYVDGGELVFTLDEEEYAELHEFVNAINQITKEEQ